MNQTEFKLHTLYKCLKHVYAKDKLNKNNLLHLPLPFRFILSTSREAGSTGFYENQMNVVERDAQGKWGTYNKKSLLMAAFDQDIRFRTGIPLKTLNGSDKIKSLVK